MSLPNKKSRSPSFDSWEWGDIDVFTRTVVPVLVVLLTSYGVGTAFGVSNGWLATLAGLVPAYVGWRCFAALYKWVAGPLDEAVTRLIVWRPSRARQAPRSGSEGVRGELSKYSWYERGEDGKLRYKHKKTDEDPET